jgi:hypothetical protein
MLLFLLFKITNSATGVTVQIKQLDCSKPHKMLGVQISPSKNQAAEHTRLTKKALEFSQQATAATINPRQARRATKESTSEG